jgi:tRNA threonylcarbamoyladenosine biosynthesis protein TsaB
MSTIIQIETATQVCSAAISVNGRTIALKEQKASNIHASSLSGFIRDVMVDAGLYFSQIDAVAVSMGPGSYTGLRIGVSTAKGLCFAVDKPLISVGTLLAMAQGFILANPTFEGLICPMIDARRMEVFTAVYNHALTKIEDVSAKIVNEETFRNMLKENKIAFIGDGAEKCASVLDSKNAEFFPENFNSASNMSAFAFEAFTAGKFEDVAYFEPFYLKDFVLTTPKKK